MKSLKTQTLLLVLRELSKRVGGLISNLITHRRKLYGNGKI